MRVHLLMIRARLVFFALAFLVPGVSHVGPSGVVWAANPGKYPVNQLRPDERPEDLKDIGITEKLGDRVSVGELAFRDESGESVKLSQFFKPHKPVVLTLVYYSCPSLCNFLLNGFMETLKESEWTVGDQFDIVTVSIDPREGPELAASKKKSYLESYGREGAENGWHFLTGDENQIKKLASQVGFGYRYVESQDEYAHGAAIFVLTPDGRISRYLYGISYPERDFRLALLEASSGKIGTVADRIMMFCFRYDADRRGYSLYVTRLVQVGSAGTIVLVGGFMFVFWRRQKREWKGGAPDDTA